MLNTGKLAGKTLYISGASRGIGLEMAKKAARDGANVVVAAKTAEPHPKLPGTIFTAAKEIEGLGGKALPMVVDVRSEEAIQDSVEQTVRQFGGIDIVINNASAISLTGTQETPMKTYDLMHQINTRGTYLVSKCCLPYLKESASKGRNPHILNNSPPLSMKPVWFKNHVAYTMAKYGMSMCVLGMAEEFRDTGIAVNAIWPKTAIMTAAMEMLGGGGGISAQCRIPQIMADAAYVILTKDSRNFTGNFCVDEHILKEVGVKDFSLYLAPGASEESLMPDFFLDEFLDHSGVGAAEAEAIVARAEKPAAVKSAAPGSADPIEAVFGQISGVLSESLVKQTNAVFSFTLSDQKTDWFLDLKNGVGSCGKGKPPVDSDATLTMTSTNFNKMFAGKLKPTAAFMSGRLKISGNMGKAMKLEKLMGKMQSRGFSTQARALGKQSLSKL
jgi:NAD(P)-dependent dehydrogenase (short-subunit alcohol dehydrogenase family)/putative sterol carrier protein